MACGTRGTLAACGLMLLVDTGLAGAQDLAENTRPSRPLLEIGLVASFIPPTASVGIGTRVVVATDERLSFEAELSWADVARHLYLPDQIVWHYVLQVAHDLTPDGRSRPRLFATYGLSGWAMRNGTTTGLRTSFLPPIIPTVGAGVQWPIASGVALRSDLQVMLLFGDDVSLATPRLSAGVSVPIRFRRAAH